MSLKLAEIIQQQWKLLKNQGGPNSIVETHTQSRVSNISEMKQSVPVSDAISVQPTGGTDGSGNLVSSAVALPPQAGGAAAHVQRTSVVAVPPQQASGGNPPQRGGGGAVPQQHSGGVGKTTSFSGNVSAPKMLYQTVSQHQQQIPTLSREVAAPISKGTLQQRMESELTIDFYFTVSNTANERQ